MPAILLSYMAIEKIGRRLGLSIAMLISGVSCGMIQILQGGPLAYLGKHFFNIINFQLEFKYQAEIKEIGATKPIYNHFFVAFKLFIPDITDTIQSHTTKQEVIKICYSFFGRYFKLKIYLDLTFFYVPGLCNKQSNGRLLTIFMFLMWHANLIRDLTIPPSLPLD